MQKPGTVTASDEIVSRVALQARRLGDSRAARELGVGREALARVIAGLPVRAGTLAMIRERLGATTAA
jgi:hypothetical protein